MDPEMQRKIEKTVIEILKISDMDEMTLLKVRNMASEKLGVDLSLPDYKKFVRDVVESFLESLEENQESNEEEADEEHEEEESVDSKKNGGREYDDSGDLIICRLSDNRRVTIQDFSGRKLVSIRDYYEKDGKQLPTRRGISLTTEQWVVFKKSVPAIEAAIKKVESKKVEIELNNQ